MHGLWRDENSSMMMKQSEPACQVASSSRTPCSTSTQQPQQSQQQQPPDPLAKFVCTDPQGNVLRPSENEVHTSGKLSKINNIALPTSNSMRQCKLWLISEILVRYITRTTQNNPFKSINWYFFSPTDFFSQKRWYGNVDTEVHWLTEKIWYR